MHIRPAEHADAAAVAAIYNHYVATTCITFETEPVSPDDMAGRIGEAREATLPWLVAVDGDAIVGYAYASKWKGRCAYRYSVESTVYLDPACTARPWQRALRRVGRCAARTRPARHHRRHRIAERREHRAARAARLRTGRALQASGLQAGTMDRRRILAAAAGLKEPRLSGA